MVQVKHLVAMCFPPSYNIFERFVHWYHISLANEINRITTLNLHGNSIIEILIFINSYLSPNFMGNPELGIAKDKLPDLLDQTQHDDLLEKYFKTSKANLSKWLDKTLEQEQADWLKTEEGDEPNADDKGYFCTDLPIILYNMITETLNVANSISNEMKNKVYDIVVEEMEIFGQSFIKAMSEYKTKHLEDRSLCPHYHKYMVASINNCKQIGENFDKIKEELKVESEADENPFDSDDSKIKGIMVEISNSGCKMLCEEVIIDLKVCFDIT